MLPAERGAHVRLDAYVATADADGIQIHQYAPARVRTSLDDGRRIAFDIETAYPADGRIRVVLAEDVAGEFTLSLRVPAWADGAQLTVHAGGHDEDAPVQPGWATARRAFRAGDTVELRLPMAPRVTRPDPRIDAARGCIAVERGPEVLALESVDLPGEADVADIVIDPAVDPVERDGRVWVRTATRRAPEPDWPYGHPADDVAGPVEVPLVPYRQWAQRGPSTMRVWIPTA